MKSLTIDDKINLRFFYKYTKYSYDDIYKRFFKNRIPRNRIRSYLNEIKISKLDSIKNSIKRSIIYNTIKCSLKRRENIINSIDKSKVVQLFLTGHPSTEIKEILNIKHHQYFINKILVDELGHNKFILIGKINRIIRLKRHTWCIGTIIAIEKCGKVKILRSFPEFVYFLYRYVCCFDEFDDIQYEVQFDTPEGKRKTDFLIKNTNYEIHDESDKINKLAFFKFLETQGIKSEFITTESCNNFYFRLLRLLGIDMINLYKEARLLNSQHKYLIYHL